jgi:hypothetical protein
MAGFMKKLFNRIAKHTQEPLDKNFVAALMHLQRAYWTPSPTEKERLRERIDTLEWPELLRLHHLNCLDLMYACGLTGANLDDFDQMGELPASPDAELCEKLVEHLTSSRSPFRPRIALVFQRHRIGQPLNANREPELRGELQNASLTHLGALEVIRTEQHRPAAIAFLPFDTLQSIQIGPASLFLSARLDYEEPDRSEVVFLPMLYGASWFTPEPILRDGSMTHFMFGPKGASVGVGLGHQDFLINEQLFGIASIELIEFPLDMRTLDFEERCRKRGLDPSEVRRSI